MKPFFDDDIEVLGNNPMPRKRKISKWWIIAAGIIVAIAIIIAVYFNINANTGVAPVYDEEVEIVYPDSIADVPLTTLDGEAIEFTDSINDVAFTAILLKGLKAAVTFKEPNPADSSIAIALPAADIRADNGEIVCEFVHNGRLLSRGVRKMGFCYISPEGKITLGCGEDPIHIREAIDGGGTFFRQYPLVMDGEIQPGTLKGKSLRRALALLNGVPAIVLSKERESIFDFSQALADYGFSDAIYLPGGRGFLISHTDKSNRYQPTDMPTTQYSNYLIFKH